LADQSVDRAELAAVSDTYRPLAELLATTSIPDRDRILDSFLAGRTDRDAIIRAVADADPTGSPPAPPILPPDPMADGPAPLPGKCDAAEWPPLPEGKRVMCTDRDPPNFGEVVQDCGDRARVHFISPSGYEATVTLHKSMLREPCGDPLTGESDSAE
jgi:hypothetical protein